MEISTQNSAPVTTGAPAGEAITLARSDFTPEQIAKLEEWGKADGWLPQGEGIEAGSDQPAQSGDPAGEAPAMIPAAIQDFEIPRPVGRDMTDEEVKGENVARGLLVDAGFDKATGSALAKEFDRVAATQATATEPQRAIYRREQETTLRRLWGDSFDKNLQTVRGFIDTLDRKHEGRIRHLLDHSGAGNSAAVAEYILRAARRGSRSA